MLLIEFILRIFPSFITILILEDIIKINKFEKLSIFFLLSLLTNVFVYLLFQGLGFSMLFTLDFAFKISISLLFINIFFMYLFLSINLKLKKRITKNKKT